MAFHEPGIDAEVLVEVLAGLFPLTPVPVGRLAGAVGLLGVPFPTRAGVGDLVVRLADGRGRSVRGR